MAANQSEFASFQLFSSSSENAQLGLGFLDSPAEPLYPPPPCVEVLLSEGFFGYTCFGKVSSSVKYAREPVNLSGGLTLFKGRVSTEEVFQLPNSDLVPGKYEGGLKLWEGSLDLVKTLQSEVRDGKLSLAGKRVLELGCGHGLPGIFTGLEGAAAIHFQDYNAEVLRCLTIPNVNMNLLDKSETLNTDARELNTQPNFRFFAGDWGEVHQILPYGQTEDKDLSQDESKKCVGYDVILMAETVYSISALPILYELIKKCLNRTDGVVYMAAKKHYFGVGGGSRRFLSLVEKDGYLAATLVAEVADGSSNVREVWKLHQK